MTDAAPDGTPKGDEDSDKATRINLAFDEAAMQTLGQVKQAYRGKTTTATVIRDALGFFSWAQREVAAGGRIAIIGSDGKVREIVLPFQI